MVPFTSTTRVLTRPRHDSDGDLVQVVLPDEWPEVSHSEVVVMQVRAEAEGHTVTLHPFSPISRQAEAESGKATRFLTQEGVNALAASFGTRFRWVLKRQAEA